MGVRGLATGVGRAALDLLFPPRCFGCGVEGVFVCRQCATEMPTVPLRAPLGPGSALDGVLAPFEMSGAAREAVHRLKYRGLRALASPMARLLADRLDDAVPRADVLMPVPLHPRRFRERGYNQAELLAGELGRMLDVPVDRAGLVRVRRGAAQATSASEAERRANVAGAFEARGGSVGRTVVVVDDVTTTGATLEACAAALRQGGVGAVWGVAFAREP